MKLNGPLDQLLWMIQGPGNGEQPFVTRANVSAVGYIPGTPGTVPQFRLATLETPEARKKGCLEAYQFGRLEMDKRDYLFIKCHRDIPSEVIRQGFLPIGSALFRGAVGGILLSALVHQDSEAMCSLLVDYKDKGGWRYFPLPFITDFHVNARGRLAVMANGCVGFPKLDDFLSEVAARATVTTTQAAYKLPWGRRVGVAEGSALTRYVLREALDQDTIAVCRNGVVSVFSEHGKLIRRIGDDAERDLAVIQSERSHGVRRTMVMTDEQGIPHRLDLMELTEADGEEAVVTPRRYTPTDRPSHMPKRQVRRVRSAISEVATEIRDTPTAPITH